jgi:hypothetical protein
MSKPKLIQQNKRNHHSVIAYLPHAKKCIVANNLPMPKRQSKKTNSSESPEISAPQQPAIVRIVKQNIPATSTNSPEPSESSSTAALRENPKVEPESQVNNNQGQSFEVESSTSSPVPTPDAVSSKISKAKAQSNFPSTAEMATVNVEELTQTDSSQAIELAQPERENKLPQLEKRIPPYQKLETVNNSQGQTFAVGDEIQVSTCNFGSQQAVITFLYSAPDGNIWATYHPLTNEQKGQWRRGCCRIEYLQKLSENVSDG